MRSATHTPRKSHRNTAEGLITLSAMQAAAKTVKSQTLSPPKIRICSCVPHGNLETQERTAVEEYAYA